LEKGSPGTSHVWGGALGLVILGGCIGALSALVQSVFEPASIKVLRGWQEGREYPLLKGENSLGRDEAVDIPLFRDMRVEKRHALIQRAGNRFVFRNIQSPPEHTRVNDEPVSAQQDLRDGDRIQLGNIVLRFQMRSASSRHAVIPSPHHPITPSG
jgi:pSer/pThr/pTyr-binding forkhead associated (FHA) protein